MKKNKLFIAGAILFFTCLFLFATVVGSIVAHVLGVPPNHPVAITVTLLVVAIEFGLVIAWAEH